MKRTNPLYDDAKTSPPKHRKRTCRVDDGSSSTSTSYLWTATSIASAMKLHQDRVLRISKALSNWKGVTVPSLQTRFSENSRTPVPLHTSGASFDPLQEHVLTEATNGRNVFITGSAGTGKTYSVKRLTTALRSNGKRVAVTASTGCAAVAIRGSTVHSFLHLGLGNLSLRKGQMNARANMSLRKKLQNTDVLVVDEVSMIDKHLVDLMEIVCSTARNVENSAYKCSAKPLAFGGLQIILCGDFFQLPPVRSGSTDLRFASESEAWKRTNLKVHVLRQAHRQTCNSFVGLLKELREGSVSGYTKKVLGACLIDGCSSEPELSPRGDLLHFTKVFPLRSQASHEHLRQLATLPGFTVQYCSYNNTLASEFSPINMIFPCVYRPKHRIFEHFQVVGFVSARQFVSDAVFAALMG